MRRTVISTVALAALVGCGGSSKGDGTDLTISLRPSGFDEVRTGQPVTLGGVLNTDATHQVQIEADPYPFDNFHRLGGGVKATGGRFEVSATPLVNTRFRATVTDTGERVTSGPTTVYASVDYVIRVGSRGALTRMVVTARIPAGARGKRGPVWLYRAPRGSTRPKKIGSGTRSVSGGRVVAVIQSRTRVVNGDVVDACVRNEWAEGMGRPGLQTKRCGDPVLKPEAVETGGE